MNDWSETLLTFGALTVELLALFLLVSFGVVLLNRRLGEERLRSWLSGGRVGAPVKGALLGALTPFCSCSTLPMLMGMLKAGAPFAGAAAFLIASPLLNPIILGVVWLLFGWRLMLGYAVVGFCSTLVIALVWERLGLARFVKRVRVAAPAGHAEGEWRGLREEARPAWEQTRSGMKPLIIPLLVGVGIGAVIYGAVPETFLAGVAGPDNLLAVPAAALIGVPLYIRTETALPIGLALTSAGMGIGPVFALIMGGAGASIPEVSMLTAIFKPYLVLAFVASVFAVAIAGGLLIPLFL